MRTKTLLTLLCSLTATAVIAACGQDTAAHAAPGQAALVTPACSWHEDSVQNDNTAGPDSAATYWVISFKVQDGLRIVLDGRYPDSRYISLETYSSSGGLFSTNGVPSALADYRIAPDPGSVNPWQRAPGQAGHVGDAYTVTLESDVAPSQANMLPLAPAGTAAGTTGYLIYRVYLPAHGGSSLTPPVVTFTLGGASKQVPACPPATTATSSATPGAAITPSAATPSAATQSVQFARKAILDFFLNADSGYLEATVTPPGDGDVLVIRGKAPTTPRGDHPSPWPAAGIDMQYWSLCNVVVIGQHPLVANPLPDGTVDYGCRYDDEVTLDRDGYYTFVVGTEAQRAAIDQIPGATFLPFSTAYPTTKHVLMLRNMLVNPSFAEAVQNVPENGSPASAAAVMGAYYPRAAICPLATLASNGPAACLAG
jgi:hypothetical protein